MGNRGVVDRCGGRGALGESGEHIEDVEHKDAVALEHSEEVSLGQQQQSAAVTAGDGVKGVNVACAKEKLRAEHCRSRDVVTLVAARRGARDVKAAGNDEADVAASVAMAHSRFAGFEFDEVERQFLD